MRKEERVQYHPVHLLKCGGKREQRTISMTHKIGIYGSNIAESEHAIALARRLGRELAQRQCIVITGACSGMPYIVAHEAHQQGAQIWGYTPELDARSHQLAYPQDD